MEKARRINMPEEWRLKGHANKIAKLQKADDLIVLFLKKFFVKAQDRARSGKILITAQFIVKAATEFQHGRYMAVKRLTFPCVG